MHNMSFLETQKTSTSPLSLDRAGIYSANQGKDFPPHRHAIWEILYFISGQIQCRVDQVMYDIQPGTLLVIPPGHVHAEFALTPYVDIYLQISGLSDYHWPLICKDGKDRAFYAICNQIVGEFGGALPQSQEMLELLLRQLDILLMREQRKKEVFSAEYLVNKVDGILKTRFTTHLTIKALAHEIGVSPSYLREQYKRLRGVTLMHSLQTMRLDYAINIISNTDMSLEVVAQLTGYGSASHLSRYIKQYTGKSPGALRKT